MRADDCLCLDSKSPDRNTSYEPPARNVFVQLGNQDKIPQEIRTILAHTKGLRCLDDQIGRTQPPAVLHHWRMWRLKRRSLRRTVLNPARKQPTARVRGCATVLPSTVALIASSKSCLLASGRAFPNSTTRSSIRPEYASRPVTVKNSRLWRDRSLCATSKILCRIE